MKKTVLPLKQLSVAELYNGNDKLIFEVPVYQRNYAWEKDEVATLIQDVFDAYQKASETYFIGTLVTFHKGDNIYEVIDGQQRLTTINLILNALGIKPSNQLTYKARKKSNETIRHIPEFNIDEKDYGIINGYKYTETAIKEIVGTEYLNEFKKYFQNSVHIIHYHVPRDIDLNHYFEIMNSRGEQLEKHEIIKARLMSALVEEKDKMLFSYIWDCCSEMGVYIQQKYNDKSVFGEDMHRLMIDRYEELPCDRGNNDGETSIRYLIENRDEFELTTQISQEDKPDSFQPIIDFPNFLLTVLKITRISEEKNFVPVNFNLDDKELINEFEKVPFDEYSGKQTFVKKFAYNLIKAKYLLDNYIVHHSKEEDTMENNPWKLQYWYKDKKHRAFRNLCDDDNQQQNILQLLSMFEVSFTARQRKNYLFYCLLFLFEKYNYQNTHSYLLAEYEMFLEKLAEKYFSDVYLVKEKLSNINVPKPGSFDETILVKNSLYTDNTGVDASVFEQIYGNGSVASKGVPLFVFNYIDYKIWKYYAEEIRGEKLKEDHIRRIAFFEKLGCGDFGLDIFSQFYFSRTRRSLEHYYPQANVSEGNIDSNQINCMGNYAMIGSEANSSGSNWSPKAKLDYYLDSSKKIKQVSVASLKFMIMMQKCKDNQGERTPGQEWNFEDIKEHQKKMLALLTGKL